MLPFPAPAAPRRPAGQPAAGSGLVREARPGSRHTPGIQHGQWSAGVQTDGASNAQQIDVTARDQKGIRGAHGFSITRGYAACPGIVRHTGGDLRDLVRGGGPFCARHDRWQRGMDGAYSDPRNIPVHSAPGDRPGPASGVSLAESSRGAARSPRAPADAGNHTRFRRDSPGDGVPGTKRRSSLPTSRGHPRMSSFSFYRPGRLDRLPGGAGRPALCPALIRTIATGYGKCR